MREKKINPKCFPDSFFLSGSTKKKLEKKWKKEKEKEKQPIGDLGSNDNQPQQLDSFDFQVLAFPQLLMN